MDNGATKERTMDKNIGCIISHSGIVTVTLDGKPYSIAPDHVNYNAVIKAIKNEDKEALLDLVDIPKAVTSYTAGAVTIVDGEVQFSGHAIHNSIATRILNLMRDDMPFKFMVKFLDNLMQNPSYRATQELYDFLEFANIPITDDGCFLAYKRVKEDYKDIYSGKFDNSVGQVLEMPRNMVDEDKNRTCSNGFHFCSLDYIPNFGASQDTSTDKVMIVKINPADVVAIPADYNNTKGRCCKYEVVAEYDGDWRKDAFTKSVHHKDGTPYEPTVQDNECPKCGEGELDEDGICPECLYDSTVCPDCGSELLNGECEYCEPEPEYCDDCGDELVDGVCMNCEDEEHEDDPDDEPNDNDQEDHGVKPNGQKFYNVRNANGQFVKKGDA